MVRAEQCARASTAGASVFSPEFICQLPASEPSYILVIAPMSAKLLVIIGTRRCVYTTAVLHDLAESMGLRGYYPSDRRITSCPKTRLYLIILLFLLHQQFYRDLSVYAISQLTWQTVLAHFFNVRLCTRLKSLAAFLHTVLRVLARPVLHEPYLVQQAR
jgi:hypothetical protein